MIGSHFKKPPTNAGNRNTGSDLLLMSGLISNDLMFDGGIKPQIAE